MWFLTPSLGPKISSPRQGVSAKIFFVRGRKRIALNRKLPIEYAQHAVGHELGHDLFDELGYVGNDIETLCDLFGAAVMAPLPAVRAMLRAPRRSGARPTSASTRPPLPSPRDRARR